MVDKNQEWLTANTEIPKSTISALANARRDYNQDHLTKIAKALAPWGVTEGMLLDINPEGEAAMLEMVKLWPVLTDDDQAELIALAKTKAQRRRSP